MIYRGFDIKAEADGTFTIRSNGPHPDGSERFPSEEAAMDAIDAAKRRGDAS